MGSPNQAPALTGTSKAFSFVHITDQHVRRKRKGNLGYATCIDSIKNLTPVPDFAVMGGDMVFDGLYNPKDEYIDQIKLYRDISDDMKLPYFHCMGNHDVLGWNARRKVDVNDPDIGKTLIQRMLKWESPYYSFNFHGWHFVVLDCILRVDDPERGPLYRPEIGPEQRDWLAADLGRAAGRPTLVFTHVAMFCNVGQINGDSNAKAMTGMVIADNREVRRILERHSVRAVIQGHSHDIQEFFYNDIWYVTSTAASAAWWGGTWTGFDQGYTLFTCDGDDLKWRHLTYEWEHQLEQEDAIELKKIEEMNAEKKAQRERATVDKERGSIMKPLPLPKQKIPLAL
jgi:3',5'-cyclic AMP phosphodiesterase CpdA